MKKLTVLMAAGLVFGASGMAMAADANTTAAIGATVLTPIAISKTTDLNFGSFAAGGTAGGTVIIATDSGRTFTGKTSAVSTGVGTVTAAAFAVSGEGTATYSITIPAGPVTITHTNTTDTMSVGTFVSNPSGAGALTAGAQTVNVGATLTVAADQLAGVYSHSTGLPITVAYN